MTLCKHDTCGSECERYSGNLKLVITKSRILDVFLKFLCFIVHVSLLICCSSQALGVLSIL